MRPSDIQLKKEYYISKHLQVGFEKKSKTTHFLICPVYGVPFLQRLALLFSMPVPRRATQQRF